MLKECAKSINNPDLLLWSMLKTRSKSNLKEALEVIGILVKRGFIVPKSISFKGVMRFAKMTGSFTQVMKLLPEEHKTVFKAGFAGLR